MLGLDEQGREVLSYLPGGRSAFPGHGRRGCTPTRRLWTSAIGSAATTTRRRTSFRELAAAGDPLFTRLVRDGVIDGLDRALAELTETAATFQHTD
jgi:hypothetical protein